MQVKLLGEGIKLKVTCVVVNWESDFNHLKLDEPVNCSSSFRCVGEKKFESYSSYVMME